MGKNQIELKLTADVNTVISALEDIVRSMKDGKVCIESGGRFVTLNPSDVIDMEIEASQKKGKEKIAIELEWKEMVPVSEAGAEFKISSQEPVIAPPESEAEEASDEDADAPDAE